MAGEDSQNVGREPRGCLASWTGNFAAKSHLHPHIDGTGCTSVAVEGGGGVRTRMRRETERGKVVDCNRRHVKEKKKKKKESERARSGRKCAAAAALSGNKSSGLQRHARGCGGSGSAAQARKISTSTFCCSSGRRAGAKSVLQHAKKEKLSSGITKASPLALTSWLRGSPFWDGFMSSCRPTVDQNHLRCCTSSGSFLLHVAEQSELRCKRNLNGGARSCSPRSSVPEPLKMHCRSSTGNLLGVPKLSGEGSRGSKAAQHLPEGKHLQCRNC